MSWRAGHLIAAIFATTLSSSPAVLTVVLVVFALLIGAMVVAAVVGLRAKRALKQLAETVEREWGATLVRVADRQVGVR